MTENFVKVQCSIVDSTIWDESPEVCKLWMTMLAKADKNGEVEASLPGLANAARLSRDQCAAGLAILMGPDPYSRSPEYEGRRVEAVSRGWKILNYSKHREMGRGEDRKPYFAERARAMRGKSPVVTGCHQMSPVVTKEHGKSPIADAEAEADTDTPAAAAAVVSSANPAAGDGARQAIQGLNRTKIRAAVASGDPLAVIGAAGGTRDEQRDAEWLRDADGMSVGELVAVLWCAIHDRAAIRQPSGLRARRAEWQAWPIEDRRGILRQAFGDLGIPMPAPRKPKDDGETRQTA